MLTGFSTGCPTDAHEELLLGFIPTYEGMRAILPIQPAIGCGNQYWIFGADETIQKISYIAEGSVQNISVVLDPTRTNHAVFAEPNGQWSTVGLAPVFDPVFGLTASNGLNVTGSFTTASEFVDTFGDLGQLTGWILTGLARYSTLRPDGLRKTEAECDVMLVKSGSNRTVTLSLNGQVLASGVGPDGTITLTANGASGVSGSVACTWSADILSGATVTKRYAASYSLDLSVSANAILNSGNAQVFNSLNQAVFHS